MTVSNLSQTVVTTSISPSYSYSTVPTSSITISGPNPSIATEKHVIDLNKVAETLEIVRERLLILVPAFEKHEKYPALKKAYEHYKLIEKIIQEESHERNG